MSGGSHRPGLSPTDPARPISGAPEWVIIDVSGPAVNSPEEFTMTPV
jgi:hypothetical protein